MQQPQKTDTKSTSNKVNGTKVEAKVKNKPAAKKPEKVAPKAVKTAAERKADREAMAKTQPMNAILESMVKPHAERDEMHELADTRQKSGDGRR